ncbi:rod shape-determining protein RodA [Halobacillus litoralis]|uniref:FtsW/RodA/SpoVE family cell cycle protein n=1 Tax=Halobacillus litoralis TaxID=45668 RepID=UPI001CD48213|nr:FtsW/RodA/SpoVE family cell cycle protein [Halobacillus litoralis]MCA0972159.1 rod shape-determining protein RodA [Halobacillus litoralis]
MNNTANSRIPSDLILVLLFFMAVSIAALYNMEQFTQASDNYAFKQGVWYAVGTMLVIGVRFFDLHQLYKLSLPAYLFGLVVLAVLLVVAQPINGAKSWFTLPGMTLQPSEFTKITTIMYLSAVIVNHKNKYEKRKFMTDLLLLFKLIGVIALPVALIMQQPDFGTSVVYLVILGAAVIFSGINWKLISLTAVLFGGIAAGLGFVAVQYTEFATENLPIDKYQVDRLETWILGEEQQADESYQVSKSLVAIGSGQLFGKGIGDLEVYIPEAQTDFIFAIIGESFGFVGCSILILVYFYLIYRLMTLGLLVHKVDPFGAYFCFGFLIMLSVHAFQNIGMTIGVMPITGIPLLLISYGGSSVLATMLGMGVVYRVYEEYLRSKERMF